MQKLSGLVLDIRDDFDGSVLRAIFPTEDSLPESIKSASALTSELDASLPDDLFGLVLVDDGVVLRKYACIDAGNTELSVEYFMRTGYKLPVEAQKTAAANLVTACKWYGLEPSIDLEKIALGLGTMLNVGMTAPGALKKTKMNLAATPPGSAVVAPSQREQLLKGAEAAGTNLMPNSQPTATGVATKTVIRKVAATGFIGDRGTDAGPAEMPDDNMGKSTGAKQPDRLPQSTALKPHVNVAGKEAPGKLTLKSAEFLAVPSLGRYPLDSYDQVKAASQYFDEWHGRMSPEHRREYSVNMVKRAKALHIPVSPVAEKYASAGYAPDHEISAALDDRKISLLDEGMLTVLDKLASARPHMSPDDFAVTLGEFDKMAGIEHLYDRHIVDPYYATFGEKRASDSIAIGNDIMYVKDLKRFAKVGFNTMKTRFGEDMATEFIKDPVGIFNSMPDDQKKIIMRIAADNSATDGENLGGAVGNV